MQIPRKYTHKVLKITIRAYIKKRHLNCHSVLLYPYVITEASDVTQPHYCSMAQTGSGTTTERSLRLSPHGTALKC
jgi:hypothetical protein